MAAALQTSPASMAQMFTQVDLPFCAVSTKFAIRRITNATIRGPMAQFQLAATRRYRIGSFGLEILMSTTETQGTIAVGPS
jgi:hypothetical protein